MGYFEQVLERSAQLGAGVDKPLQPARQWLAKADALNKQLGAARAAEEAEHAKHIETIANTGKLPSLNGFGTWSYDSPTSRLVVSSVALCHQNAASAGRSSGPAIFEALVARVADVVAESVQQSVALPRGVDSEAKALRARNGDRKALDTWERLRALVDEWTACHELVRVMQRAGWVDGPGHATDRQGAWGYERYEKPLLLPPGYWDRTPAELRLGVAQASGAAPGLYPWSDAVARWQRLDRRQRNYGSMEVVQLHDSMGNVVAEQRGPERPAEFVSAGRRP